MMRPGIGFFILVALAGVARPAEAQISVDQIELFMTPRQPTRSSAVINVANEGSRATQATIYTADWDRDSLGVNRFFQLGSLPQSCGNMIQVFPTAMRLEPHTQQAVRVNLVGADTLARACWTVVFVEMQDVNPAASGRSVQYVLRTGTKVYVEPENLPRDGAIQEMKVVRHVVTPEELRTNDPAAKDTSRRDFSLTFRNTGGMQLRPSGKVEIRRPDNSLTATVNLEEFPILPGATRVIHAPMPKLPMGRYLAIAVIDFGGSDLVGGQTEFVAP